MFWSLDTNNKQVMTNLRHFSVKYRSCYISDTQCKRAWLIWDTLGENTGHPMYQTLSARGHD